MKISRENFDFFHIDVGEDLVELRQKLRTIWGICDVGILSATNWIK
jgi:hypothetical protein